MNWDAQLSTGSRYFIKDRNTAQEALDIMVTAGINVALVVSLVERPPLPNSADLVVVL